MTERYRCRHGLTLTENCDACEVEMAMERDRRLGPIVDEARRVIERTESVRKNAEVKT